MVAGRIRRLAALVLAMVLALPLGAGPAAAAPDGAAAAVVLPLAPNSLYPAELNARIRTFDDRLSARSGRERDLAARERSLDGRVRTYNQRSKAVLDQLDRNRQRIRAHNAQVAAYPRGAPPRVADALNAQARSLNAEQRRLKQQAQAIASDGEAIKREQRKLEERQEALDEQRATLTAERRELLRDSVSALVKQNSRRPLVTVRSLGGGDVGRLTDPVGARPAADGGDSASPSPRVSALRQYARTRNTEVDTRPVGVLLPPEAVARATGDEAGALRPYHVVDGLERNRDGTYTALEVVDPARGSTEQRRAFHEAVRRGGPAHVIGNRRITVSGIREVPGASAPKVEPVAEAPFPHGGESAEAAAVGARDRAAELHALLSNQANTTTAVIGVFDTRARTWTLRVAVNAPAGGPPSTRPGAWALRDGLEEFVPGVGHAEEIVVNGLRPNEVVAFGGVVRNVCRDICFKALNTRGMQFGGEGDYRGTDDKTPFSYFWVADWWE